MAGKSFNASFKLIGLDRRDLLNTFHDHHEKGVKRFRGRWLTANIAATDAARDLGIPLDNPIVMALLSKVIFKILTDLANSLDGN